jgi:ABC-type Zn2+ transport system substrate-binding protein/surface adhesin
MPSTTAEGTASRPAPTLNNLPPELKSLIVNMIEEVDEAEYEGEEDEDEDIEEELVGDDGEVIEEDHAEASAHSHGHGHGHEHGEGEEHEHEHGGGCCGGGREGPTAMASMSQTSKEFSVLASPFLWQVSHFASSHHGSNTDG